MNQNYNEQGYYPSYEQYNVNNPQNTNVGGYDNNMMNNNNNGPMQNNNNNIGNQQPMNMNMNMNMNMMNNNNGGVMPNNSNMFYSPPNMGTNYNPQQPSNMYPNPNSPNMGNFPDPNQFIANFSNNPLAQAGLSYGINYGQSLFTGGKQYVDSNLGKYISFSTLKSYFNVNTSYVFNKIKLLLFPFIQKTWKRRIHRHGDVDSFLPPRDDINAPDLYIPLMAFITYFLLYGFRLGMDTKFSPDVLGASISKYIIYWILEVALFRLGFFFTNSDSIYFYDMVSYTGYKYVLLVGKAASNVVVGSYATWLLGLYLAICMGYFILKTLRLVFSSSNQNSDQYHQQSNTDVRSYFVLIFAGIQAGLTFLY